MKVNKNYLMKWKNFKRNIIINRLPSTLFPFGEDPFGNLLCFDYSDNQSAVFWNHEMLDNNGQNTVFMAQSFTDFIN
ncbi:TPA: SMI1/KNR4 family protein [Streptococcus suis]|nr:SMI1/KNR4 family protein [Streptococcus suis]